jgi:hypothetical protein
MKVLTMTSEKITQRIYIKNDYTATITCPQCQISKDIHVSKFRAIRHTIKARCTCGHSFDVNFDFRKHHRKKTALPGVYETLSKADNQYVKKTRLTGVYTMQAPGNGHGPILVTNISSGGLQFNMPGSHAIEIGQRAQVAFALDDRHQTEINMYVTILSVDDEKISCQFDTSESLGPGLRFYLFPWLN